MFHVEHSAREPVVDACAPQPRTVAEPGMFHVEHSAREPVVDACAPSRKRSPSRECSTWNIRRAGRWWTRAPPDRKRSPSRKCSTWNIPVGGAPQGIPPPVRAKYFCAASHFALANHGRVRYHITAE